MYSKVLLAVLCIAVLTIMTSSAPSKLDVDSLVAEAQQSGMQLIGQIGNKVYFMNKTESPWSAGVSRCNSSNLQFGTLRNYEEFAFVRQSMNNSDNLWIAASMRGINTNEVFKAFEYIDGSDVPSDVNAMSEAFGTNLCLYLSGSDHTYTDSCSNARYGVLCQVLV